MTKVKSAKSMLRVELGERSYDIRIAGGMLSEIGTTVAKHCSSKKAIVISNSTVAPLYFERVRASLSDAGIESALIELDDGERFKNAETLQSIYDELWRHRVERKTPLLALGGGVIGDMTGYAAATYLRGLPFIQLPTTLLAQVDSSVGGKTGINHAKGKNLIGAFHQPKAVLIDLDTLRSLPRREFLSGLVELIKHGIILDTDLMTLIEDQLDSILALDPEILARIIHRSCEIKAEVVSRDEREGNFRAVLNFGHTLGHAVESLTGYKRYLHGEAVAIGTVFSAKLSEKRGYCDRQTVERIEKLFSRAGLDIEIPEELQEKKLARAIAGDKKAAEGEIKFVCLNRIGETRFAMMPAEEIATYVHGV